MYKQNIVPTIALVRCKLDDMKFDIPYCEETLRCYLKSIGFYYGNIDKRMAIMETARLQRHRLEYVTEIRKFREQGREIIYLDETWFDTHDVKTKGLTDKSRHCFLNVPPSRGKRVIILHAGGANGWVRNGLLISAKNIKDSSADYHQDMNAPLFETWFTQQLIPNLPANSVIVMDNAKYHSQQFNKQPSSASRKDDMLAFMRTKDIEIPAKATKKQLLEIIKKLNLPIKHRIDEIAKQNGHTVLRLPPYYCVFNPIELIWSSLKRGIKKNNTRPNVSSYVIDVIRSEVEKITETLWRSCIKHVIDIEDSYVSTSLQHIIITNANESEEEEESLSDD